MVFGSMSYIPFGKNLINILITFFHLNAFSPLHFHKTVVEYIYKMIKEGVKMQILKEIKEIKFNSEGISEPIVMASAAGWYIGSIDKSEGFLQPYDRYTGYMTQQDAEKALKEVEAV